MTAVFIFLAIALLLVSWAVGAYNRLARARKRVIKALMSAAQELTLRHELIPTLIEVVSVYMKPEREVLEAVIAARNDAVVACANAALNPGDATQVRQLSAAESLLSVSLGKMAELSAGNADLNTDQNIRALNQELAAIEGRIAYARQSYNETVSRFNSSLAQFPGSLIANMFAFKRAEQLQMA